MGLWVFALPGRPIAGPGLDLFLVLATMIAMGCERSHAPGSAPAPASRPTFGTAHAGETPPELTSCARCHLLPPPELLPRGRWGPVLRRMGEITSTYRLDVQLTPAEVAAAERWYEARAPQALLDVDPPMTHSPLDFRGAGLGRPLDPGSADFEPPRLTHVVVCDLDGDGWNDVLASDAGRGEISWVHRTAGEGVKEETLVTLSAPARFAASDLDGDGDLDLAVASLGTLAPTEELVGSVVLCIDERPPGSPTPRLRARTVLQGVARVSDVRAADLDGDGDLDLAVACFGLYRAGGVLWLERKSDGSYRRHDLLVRNGVSHVPAADLDGDGRMDLVALVSQEHEELLLYHSRGAGRFTPRLLFKAAHPMFGLSGIELVDLDGDGDQDVLFCNGDALDQDPTPKPWHAVHWLENRRGAQGEWEFAHHELVRFPGAYCAIAGDLDGDGDLDVVVSSMLNRWSDPSRQSLIWLENFGQGRFEAHPLAIGPTHQVSLALGDLEGDGGPELVGAGLYLLPPFQRIARLTRWTIEPRRSALAGER
jgi:hypothetical protein